MRDPTVRALGLAAVSGYAAFILWVYLKQPQTTAEVIGGLSATVGVYRIDQQAFDDGLRFFRQDDFVPARSTFERADPAHRDARTQFYIAYSYYRQGWGRLYQDDVRFGKALAPGGRLVVEDPDLQMKSADELRAELEAGMKRDMSDLNPVRAFQQRK